MVASEAEDLGAKMTKKGERSILKGAKPARGTRPQRLRTGWKVDVIERETGTVSVDLIVYECSNRTPIGSVLWTFSTTSLNCFECIIDCPTWGIDWVDMMSEPTGAY